MNAEDVSVTDCENATQEADIGSLAASFSLYRIGELKFCNIFKYFV